MSDKRFRMFAGPNGSGKTTLIEQIGQQFNLGYFINADLIQKSLDTQGITHPKTSTFSTLSTKKGRFVKKNKFEVIFLMSNLKS
jgi:predicted ABC-type ATPase